MSKGSNASNESAYRHTCPQCGEVLTGANVDLLIQGVLVHSRNFHDTDVLELVSLEELRHTIQQENEHYWAHVQHLIANGSVKSILEDKLTSREQEIVRYVAHGFSDQETADHLAISIRTVSTHLTNIYEKLDVHSRSELVMVVRAADRIIESRFRSPKVFSFDPFTRPPEDEPT